MKETIIDLATYSLIVVSLLLYFKYVSDTTKQPKPPEVAEELKVDIKTDEELENYLVSVVSCEMPALYEQEALKAQAIASRTYALYQRDVNNVSLTKQDQCFYNEEEMKEKWGSDYEKYHSLIAAAVSDTESLVMTKNDSLFKSFYFSTSNGYTEDSMTVFKEGSLTSVSSEWDKENKNFEVKSYFEKNNLVSLLGEFNEIEVIKRSDTNHVEEVRIDDKVVTGIDFRKLLNLRSTDFIINEINGTYEITTYGYGHGVGMSQFGANMLAKDNKSYEEILKYYYGEIDLKKY